MKRTDTATRIISAPAAKIYETFLDAGEVLKWLPPTGMKGEIHTYEPKPGGKIHLSLYYQNSDHANYGKTSTNVDVVQGRFVELVPNQKIVQVFEFVSEDPAFAGAMTMSWIFTPLKNGTELKIICENVPVGISKEDHEVGMQSTLENLARLVE